MAERVGFDVSLAVVLLGAMSGCGGSKLVPVEGIVNLDGKPLAGATVVFLPDGAPGRPAQSMTAGDGRFRLSTVSEQGAEPGNYKVTITKTVGILPPGAEPPSPDDERKMRKQREDFDKHSDKYLRSLIPTVYGSPTSTPLRCKVPSGQPVVVNLTSAGSSSSTSRDER
jgi:hypothetical protein